MNDIWRNMINLDADLVMELSVNIGEPQIIGQTSKGFLQVIPITGGTFTGPDMKGIIICGGADWNTRINDRITHVFAKYTLCTDDGFYISIENEGYIDEANTQTIIKTTPKFRVDNNSKFGWLECGVFVGSLKDRGDSKPGVLITMFKMR